MNKTIGRRVDGEGPRIARFFLELAKPIVAYVGMVSLMVAGSVGAL